MHRPIERRRFLSAGLAAGATLAAAPRVFAAPLAESARDGELAAIAKRELERAGEAIWRKDIVGIADFGLPSSQPRFHFVNLEAGNVRSFLVAHGKGSDPDHDAYLDYFSNTPGSNATARGAYVTWEWYKGKYGTSIRLGGLEGDNSHTLDRAIVMHAAWYAEPEMVAQWGKLGRSNGCFAMAPADFKQALWNLSGGRLLFADKLGLY